MGEPRPPELTFGLDCTPPLLEVWLLGPAPPVALIRSIALDLICAGAWGPGYTLSGGDGYVGATLHVHSGDVHAVYRITGVYEQRPDWPVLTLYRAEWAPG